MWQTESCYFEPFFITITRKIKILENWKNCLEISSFYTSVPKIMIICYTVPVIWCITDVIVIFHFGLFFALSKNQNFRKMKKRMEKSLFYSSVPTIMIICYTVSEIWCMTDVISFHFGPCFPLLPPKCPKNQNF